MLAATEGARCPRARPPRRAFPRVDRRVPAVVRAPRSSDHLRLRSRAVATTTRRNVVVAASAESSRGDESKRRYVNFTGFPFPLVPFLSRRTVVNEVVKGVVWTLEQEQGIGFDLGVSTNVRCTIVKMRDGSSGVHDPIAPTGECVEAIEAIGGDVAYVVLATTQYEHKIFAGPFARKFPDAEVWIAPGQFRFRSSSRRSSSASSQPEPSRTGTCRGKQRSTRSSSGFRRCSGATTPTARRRFTTKTREACSSPALRCT